jgi:hypothetical protein
MSDTRGHLGLGVKCAYILGVRNEEPNDLYGGWAIHEGLGVLHTQTSLDQGGASRGMYAAQYKRLGCKVRSFKAYTRLLMTVSGLTPCHCLSSHQAFAESFRHFVNRLQLLAWCVPGKRIVVSCVAEMCLIITNTIYFNRVLCRKNE